MCGSFGLNDGTTWNEQCNPVSDNLDHLCICHAIHELNNHKPYSIPDMNDFLVEVTVMHQHIAE